jgi:hypothetical protein
VAGRVDEGDAGISTGVHGLDRAIPVESAEAEP